ncbi:MAG: hypothetical protein QOJ13_38 [Gaiellales bacterium]|jgi:hypothetical protein|nr:hypothetical protein [Gaiellales bacterium]
MDPDYRMSAHEYVALIKLAELHDGPPGRPSGPTLEERLSELPTPLLEAVVMRALEDGVGEGGLADAG